MAKSAEWDTEPTRGHKARTSKRTHPTTSPAPELTRSQSVAELGLHAAHWHMRR
jgi:hypothetical protein